MEPWEDDAHWLALCMASEANQPHEWPYIGWVVRNRTARYVTSHFPYRTVILAPMQFSYFNDWTKLVVDEREPVASAHFAALYRRAMEGYAGNQAEEALSCALGIMGALRWMAPFGADVRHYYSPISMKPRGKKPSWIGMAKRTFTPSGVDPERFVFAAGVP